MGAKCIKSLCKALGYDVKPTKNKKTKAKKKTTKKPR